MSYNNSNNEAQRNLQGLGNFWTDTKAFLNTEVSKASSAIFGVVPKPNPTGTTQVVPTGGATTGGTPPPPDTSNSSSTIKKVAIAGVVVIGGVLIYKKMHKKRKRR